MLRERGVPNISMNSSHFIPHQKVNGSYPASAIHGNKYSYNSKNGPTISNDECKSKNSNSISGDLKTKYLHIAPDGDYWVGTTIFAAKHLQPDYIKSIPIPKGFDPEDYFENLLDPEEAEEILRKAYDDGTLPFDVTE